MAVAAFYDFHHRQSGVPVAERLHPPWHRSGRGSFDPSGRPLLPEDLFGRTRRIVMGVPRLILTLLANCAGVVVAAAIIPSISYGHRLGTLVLASLILAFVNFALRPIVILMALPAVILTLGLGLLLINALMLWVTSKIVTGFHVGGFWSTVGGALVMGLVNLALRPWTRRRRRDDERGRYVRIARSGS